MNNSLNNSLNVGGTGSVLNCNNNSGSAPNTMNLDLVNNTPEILNQVNNLSNLNLASHPGSEGLKLVDSADISNADMNICTPSLSDQLCQDQKISDDSIKDQNLTAASQALVNNNNFSQLVDTAPTIESVESQRRKIEEKLNLNGNKLNLKRRSTRLSTSTPVKIFVEPSPELTKACAEQILMKERSVDKSSLREESLLKSSPKLPVELDSDESVNKSKDLELLFPPDEKFLGGESSTQRPQKFDQNILIQDDKDLADNSLKELESPKFSPSDLNANHVVIQVNNENNNINDVSALSSLDAVENSDDNMHDDHVNYSDVNPENNIVNSNLNIINFESQRTDNQNINFNSLNSNCTSNIDFESQVAVGSTISSYVTHQSNIIEKAQQQQGLQ